MGDSDEVLLDGVVVAHCLDASAWLEVSRMTKTKLYRLGNPEDDLFSDAMDRAAGTFHGVQFGARKNAEAAGQPMDGEKLIRRALAAAINDYLEEIGPVDEPSAHHVQCARYGWPKDESGGPECSCAPSAKPDKFKAGDEVEITRVGKVVGPWETRDVLVQWYDSNEMTVIAGQSLRRYSRVNREGK